MLESTLILLRDLHFIKRRKSSKADKGTNSDWFLGKNGKPLNVSGDTVTITARSLGGRPKIDFGGITLSTKIDPNIREGAAKLAEAGNTRAKTDLFSQLKQEGTVGQSMYGHGESKGDFNLNPDMLLGIGDFLASKIGIDRTAQKWRTQFVKGWLVLNNRCHLSSILDLVIMDYIKCMMIVLKRCVNIRQLQTIQIKQ